jgi:GntR family transcriptional regulator/MocR family aminotransferase
MRKVLSDYTDVLRERSPNAGCTELREAIKSYLIRNRGMNVESSQIVIGSGAEYLYGLIIQLLGKNRTYAIEDPGYQKISRIYKANQVSCVHIPIDENGISVQALEQTDANILHISPSHHFPTGIVTPISRRYELLSWASKTGDRYIIEDDYDSEFRLLGKPIPPLQSIDVLDKVIYMNTFSKSLASTIRISYMVLPMSLLSIYQEQLGFYSCTVSNFEQYTLARFIEKGYLEKHINRMRNFYRTQRDTLLSCIRNYCKDAKVQIKEEHAGLHFLLEVETKHSDLELIEQAAMHGVRISCLSQYFHNPKEGTPHTLVINYSGIDIMNIKEAVEKLFRCLA